MREMRLLALTDDKATQAVLGRLCRKRGFELVQSGTTDAFRKSVTKSTFDLVVLDLDTENVDGMRMLNALASARFTAPVVLVSQCDDRTLDAAQQVGTQRGLCMGRPLVKPLGENSTVRSILNALGIYDPTITASNVRQAIDNEQLHLNYQPLVDVKTGAVRSVEALLRWEHPEFGHLNPEMVVSIAEQSGQIDTLTSWVLDTALKQCAKWRKQGWNFRIAVNVTPSLLLEAGFADSVVKVLDKTGVPPESLVIEITEGEAIAEQVEVLETLARLRLARVNLAIDDFGTGYSSLGRLHSLPFTELKIDKSFVMDTAGDPRLEMVVRAIADLGRNLGLTVIAEGVANREAWDLVESMGCDIAQGYFVSRPLPADTFTEWLYRWDVPTTVTARIPGEHAARKRSSEKKASSTSKTPAAPAGGASRSTARVRRR